MTNANNIETTAVAMYDKDTNVFSMAVDMSELKEQIVEDYKKELSAKADEILKNTLRFYTRYTESGNKELSMRYLESFIKLQNVFDDLGICYNLPDAF